MYSSIREERGRERGRIHRRWCCFRNGKYGLLFLAGERSDPISPLPCLSFYARYGIIWVAAPALMHCWVSTYPEAVISPHAKETFVLPSYIVGWVGQTTRPTTGGTWFSVRLPELHELHPAHSPSPNMLERAEPVCVLVPPPHNWRRQRLFRPQAGRPHVTCAAPIAHPVPGSPGRSRRQIVDWLVGVSPGSEHCSTAYPNQLVLLL